ncbi:hypothetical protein NMY22_g11739 [Coprinellus aureogranulatus]|nr:hypothetical protein NMY22_g11739 [Coprinellus aureogranulatus]
MTKARSKDQRSASGEGRSTEANSKLKYYKTEKLLKWTAEEPGLRLREAALHLFEATDDGFIPHLLSAFDISKVPSLSAKRGDPGVLNVTDSTTQALLKLLTVFQALSNPSSHPNALAFSEHTHRCALEQWDGITQWMLYFLRAPSALGSPRALVDLVNQTLIAMFEGNKDNTYKQELISRESTIDVIFTSLCLIDPETRHYHYIATTDRDPCCILDLLNEVVARSELGLQAAILRYQSLTAKQRKALVKALVDRPQIPVWKSKAGTLGAVKSRTFLTMALFRLIGEDSTGSLWGTFNRRHWLHTHLVDTCAIANMVHKRGAGADAYEYWWYLGRCLAAAIFCTTMSSPNPSACIHKLVEDGVLSCAAMAIPYMDDTWTMLIDSLSALIPYVYLNRVMTAVQRRGDDLEYRKMRRCPDTFKATYMEYANGLNSPKGFPYVHAALHPEMNICNNLGVSGIYLVQRLDTWAKLCAVGSILFQTHRSREESRRTGRVGTVIPWPTVPTLVKGKTGKGSTAGSVSSIGTYTNVCNILSLSLPFIAHPTLPLANKASGTWVSARTRYDQLRTLQAALNVNDRIPSPSHVTRNEPLFAPPIPKSWLSAYPQSHLSSKSKSSWLVTYDFHATAAPRMRFNLRLALESYIRMSWTDPEYEFVEDRVQACIDDLENDSESGDLGDGKSKIEKMLVEGIFRIGVNRVMKVFARVIFDPAEREGERYKVVNSVFRAVGNLQNYPSAKAFTPE